MWIVFACLSALFAGITSILAKCGIRHTDSDVATAIRTIVVLVFSFVMVGLVGSVFHPGQHPGQHLGISALVRARYRRVLAVLLPGPAAG